MIETANESSDGGAEQPAQDSHPTLEEAEEKGKSELCSGILSPASCANTQRDSKGIHSQTDDDEESSEEHRYCLIR